MGERENRALKERCYVRKGVKPRPKGAVMSKTFVINGKRLATGIAFVSSSVFLGVTGCTTYVQEPPRRVIYEPAPAPREVYVAPAYAPPPQEPSPSYVDVEIRAESDFYEPLTPYGRWEVVGNHGRCWIPARVESNWRPYCNGHWQRTEAGWYWASEEPWGWATYHYGRWDLSPQFGWYWVPQTQWAPAWVSWHEGGGYVGWAPLHPSARVSSRGSVDVNVAVIAPRAYVFVEPRHFLQPVRPSTVVVNNTTIINKTVNITNVKMVNKNVINEGPRTTVIEQASGQRIQPVTTRELRRKDEAPMAARRRAAPNISETPVQTPVPRVNETTRTKSSGRAGTPRPGIGAECSDRAAKKHGGIAEEGPGGIERLQKEGKKSQEKAQRDANELARKNQLESERRAERTQRFDEKAQREANELARRNQLESERRAQEAARNPGRKKRRGITEEGSGGIRTSPIRNTTGGQ